MHGVLCPTTLRRCPQQVGKVLYIVTINGRVQGQYDSLRAAQTFCRVFNTLTRSRSARVKPKGDLAVQRS
jgi:hypothetical protein